MKKKQYSLNTEHFSFELPYSKEEVTKMFLNTPIERYVDCIYKFWQSENILKFTVPTMCWSRGTFQKYILGCSQVADIALAAKQGRLSGKGWSVTVDEDLEFISNRLESCLLDKLKEFDGYFQLHHPDDEPDGSHIYRWGRMLDQFPRFMKLEYNKEVVNQRKFCSVGCEPVFSEQTLMKICDQLRECVEISKNFEVDDEGEVINRFLVRMLEKGIPQSRAVYRELYKVLDLFDAIPPHVKHSHETTSSRDPQSNYIKSLVNTIRNNMEEKKKDNLN